MRDITHNLEIKHFKLISIIGLLFLAFNISAKEGTSHSKSNYDNVDIESIHLNNGIYMLTGKGGNIGLCIGEGRWSVYD